MDNQDLYGIRPLFHPRYPKHLLCVDFRVMNLGPHHGGYACQSLETYVGQQPEIKMESVTIFVHLSLEPNEN